VLAEVGKLLIPCLPNNPTHEEAERPYPKPAVLFGVRLFVRDGINPDAAGK
jgi:hypothetical protein